MTILEGSKIADFITESLVACLDDLEYWNQITVWSSKLVNGSS